MGTCSSGEADLAGHGVLDALQQLAGDAERARHDAAGRAGVHALVQDVDDERAPGQPPQRRRDPQPLVVVAAGVEAQHERGRAEAPGQRLEVGGQVGRAALLAGLDQHDAAGVGTAGPLHRLDGGEGRERRVAVVGPAPAVEPAVLDDGRPRPQPLPPAVHLRLLVQVAVEQDGVGRVAVAEGRDLDDDERRPFGQLDDLDRHAGDRAARGTSRRRGRRRGSCGRCWPSPRRRPARGRGWRCSRGGWGRCRRTRPRRRRRGSSWCPRQTLTATRRSIVASASATMRVTRSPACSSSPMAPTP